MYNFCSHTIVCHLTFISRHVSVALDQIYVHVRRWQPEPDEVLLLLTRFSVRTCMYIHVGGSQTKLTLLQLHQAQCMYV